MRGIIVVKSYEFTNLSALVFTDMINLQISHIAVYNSTICGLQIINVFGNSVIEHSSFDMISYSIQMHISVYYTDCIYTNFRISALFQILYPRSFHSISIENCIFKGVGGRSIHATLELNSFAAQIDISNITTLGHQHNDITLEMKTKAPYTVRIRDSIWKNNGWNVISIYTYSFGANQKIEITNCTLTGHITAIYVSSNHVDIRHKNHAITVTYAAPEIKIERTVIRDNNLNMTTGKRGTGLHMICEGINYSQPSVVLKNVLFSFNIESGRPPAVKPGQPAVVYLIFAQNVSFIDCSFVDNRGSPIIAYRSHFNVSGTLNFINNTGYEGGAVAFHDDSSMSVQNNTEVLFAGNYAQHVGGAIFVKRCETFIQPGLKSIRRCFFQFPHVKNIFSQKRIYDSWVLT